MDLVANSTASIGRAIRDGRRRAGLTQAALAMRIGLQQPTVSNIERGAKQTTLDTVLRLLAALQLELVVRDRGTEDLLAPWSED